MSDARPTTELGRCLVTGGAGYLGSHLVRELVRRGHRVRVFDLEPWRSEGASDGVEGVRGDVRDKEALRKACEGIDTVFHTAAVLDFDRFPSRAQRERSQSINVRGVENVIDAARHAGVRRLIHTSTNNVIFSGPLIDGDETAPYAQKPKDLYTATKILGEQAVLSADGEDGLHTCALRPGGIYGPGEKLIFPRLIEQLVRGRYVVTLGNPDVMSDNTFIENLVDGHIEAARHLVPGSPVCGSAYFITDGAPINYFEFFRPYVEDLGYVFPKRRLPTWPMYALTWLWELAGKPSNLLPLTNLELRKIVVSHYARIDKAGRDFGWTPPISAEQATERCLPYVRRLHADVEIVDRPHWAWWVAIPFGMASLALLAFHGGAHAAWETTVTTWTPRWVLQPLFAWAALLHVYKGMNAVRQAERAGLRRTSLGWGWQTFLLGFPSMRLLERRIARTKGSDEPLDS